MNIENFTPFAIAIVFGVAVIGAYHLSSTSFDITGVFGHEDSAKYWPLHRDYFAKFRDRIQIIIRLALIK